MYINQMLINERKQTRACKIIYWRVEHIYKWNACDHYLFTEHRPLMNSFHACLFWSIFSSCFSHYYQLKFIIINKYCYCSGVAPAVAVRQ